jgi:hypothetical protein
LRKFELIAVKQVTERWFSTPRRWLRSRAPECDPGAVPRRRRRTRALGRARDWRSVRCPEARAFPGRPRPRHLERRATRRAFLSTGPTLYCPCFAWSDASPLHARRPRRVAVRGSNAGRLLRRTVEGPAGYKGRRRLVRRLTAAAGAIEGSRGEPRAPVGCTPTEVPSTSHYT